MIMMAERIEDLFGFTDEELAGEGRTPKEICALIEFSKTGCKEHYKPEGDRTSSGREGYAKPENWTPSKDKEYPDGTPVLDMRPAIERGGTSVSIKAPLFKLNDPYKDDPFSARAEKLLNARGGYNYAKCGLEEHLAYWTRNGARLGHLKDGRIMWEGNTR